MNKEAQEKESKVSRRVFLSATATGVAGLVVGGIIGSQAFPREVKITETKVETTTLTKPTTITQTSTVTVAAEPGLPSPPSIPDEKIAETITADIVVVGAGLAGLMAAYAAAEEGATTVVIEKYKGPNVRGAHINPGPAGKYFKEAGISVDYEKALREQIDVISGNKVDESLIRLWLANSSKIADFIADLAKANGIPVRVLKPKTYLEEAWKDWPRPTYKFSDETDFDGVAQLAPLLEKIAKDKGARFYYNTKAVQLIRERGGRVTGVIAQDANGNYIKFNSNKAVILCTGDYSSNKDLLKLWAPPEVARLADMPNRIIYPMITPTNTGDGQLMGLWIGAALDEPPHCPLCYIMTGGDLGFSIGSLAGFGPGKGYMLICNPFLFVNILGERFTNEALPWMWTINRVLQQPKAMYWTIFDSTWEDQVTRHGGGYRRITDPELGREFLEGAIKNGAAVTADTIEELAEKMQIPVETFKKTIMRYNELCGKGVDEDFGKPSRYMVPVEKPPFYAVQGIAVLLNMVGGGLKVNNKLQVLDKENKPIPGLYAAGNAAGSFYAQYYSLVVIPGLSHSRAVTFGYLAGKNAVRS